MIIVLLRLFRIGIPGWMSPLVKWLIDIAIILAALGGLWLLSQAHERSVYNRGFDAGWASLKAKDDAAVKASEQRNVKATARADVERAADTKKIQSNQDERDVAIKKAPASSTGAATRAANCVRWRAAHRGSTTTPPGC